MNRHHQTGRWAHSIPSVGFVVLGALMSARPVVAQDYTVIEIGTLGGTFSKAWDINSLGHVVGVSQTASGQDHGFLWVNGALTDLGTLGGSESEAFGISDDGEIVGEAQDGNGNLRAFLWQTNAMIDLGTLGGADSSAHAINNNHQVVGWAQAGGPTHAFLWEGGTMTDLTPIGGFGQLFSQAFGINSEADVVGNADEGFPIFNVRASLWQMGEASLIATQHPSVANAVNSALQIVGRASGLGAFLWQDMVLKALAGGGSGIATDINSQAQIVGCIGCSGVPVNPRAVIWEAGMITDLNDVIPAGSRWVLESAEGINDLGQIVGFGTLNGETRGFLLTRLVVETIDPVPSLLSGPDVTTSLEALGSDLGRMVVGLASDGVTRIVLRVQGVPGPGDVAFEISDENGLSVNVGTLRSVGGSEDVTSLSVPVVTLADGRHIAFAVLVAPDDFVRDVADESVELRPITLDLEYTPSGGGELLTASQQIQLRRPPVMLLHGLWSNEATWNHSIQSDSRFNVHAEDYESTNAENFGDNVIQARVGVGSARDLLRELGFAATQVDVIGHSMGGLLSRLYVANLDNVGYIRNDNFGEGDINRLITLDTPHLGSPLGDVLLGITEALNLPMLALWLVVTDGVFGCVQCGAVGDLSPSSLIITNLPIANVPSHAIVGKGGSDVIQQGLEEIVLSPLEKAILKVLRAVGAISSDIFPPGSQHDLVVGRISQEGGLSAGSGLISLFGFDMPPGTIAAHFTVTGTDAAVGDRIIELLNTPVADASVFAPAFPAATGGGGGASGFEPPPFGNLVSGIVITDPLMGALVTPGQPLSVTVEPIDGFVPMHVLVVSRFEAGFDETGPFTMDLDIPIDAIGALTLFALAFDAEWNMAGAMEVVVQIDVSASLTGIAFSADTAFVYIDLDPTYQARVFGSYDDGIERNITSSELGTVYESLYPGIVTIDTEGMVTGLSDGTATVRATNGPHTATAQIFVKSFPSPADITGPLGVPDGCVDAFDLGAMLAAWCSAVNDPNPPSPPCENCTPANLAIADIAGPGGIPDGCVDAFDLAKLLAEWCSVAGGNPCGTCFP